MTLRDSLSSCLLLPLSVSALVVNSASAHVTGVFDDTLAFPGLPTGNVTQQVDFMVANTTAPWGTTYACFRVPTAVVTLDGTIVVLAESRIGDCGDQAPKDVTSRRSADGGLTWSPLQLVAGPTTHAPNATSGTPDFTARNPYATTLPNGTILLQWVNSTDPDNCFNLQQTSNDSGATWSPPVRKDFGKWEGVLLGPGAGIVLGTHSPSSQYAGRVLACGATGYVGGMPMVLPIYYSDDDGETYTQAGGAAPYPALQECQLVELSDGTVMVNARNAHLNSTCDCRAVAFSHDGGETWGDYTFDPALIEPVCSAGLINVQGTLYFSNPASRTSRVNMTLKRSGNDGATWEDVALVFQEGLTEYSVLVDLTGLRADSSLVEPVGGVCTGPLTNGTRPGQDYASIKMNSTSATSEDCQALCCADEKCQTFVYVPDGLYPNRPQGTFCWLKAAAIPLQGDTCDNGKPGCVSGVVERTPPPPQGAVTIGVVYERRLQSTSNSCGNCVSLTLAIVEDQLESLTAGVNTA
eukprot:INCI6538.2.p1 GENE.INCI6538.2~~INCI6538.2.p1  ORF type:complete len:523 (-),score=64.15 INCI6538.2:114-1682(-)